MSYNDSHIQPTGIGRLSTLLQDIDPYSSDISNIGTKRSDEGNGKK